MCGEISQGELKGHWDKRKWNKNGKKVRKEMS